VHKEARKLERLGWRLAAFKVSKVVQRSVIGLEINNLPQIFGCFEGRGIEFRGIMAELEAIGDIYEGSI
jgi:hypothetical protein